MFPLRLTRRLLNTPTVTSQQQQLAVHCGRYLCTSMANNDGSVKPIEKAIITKLTDEFKPTHLEVINESHMHNVPPGSESHFKVVVISDEFEKQNLISRHRMVHMILKEELSTAIHALSIQAKTPSQWEDNPTVSKSPPCLGGKAAEDKKGKT